MDTRDAICRELYADTKARCVFLVDANERVLVALGDLSLEEAQGLVSTMVGTELDDSGQTFHVEPSMNAIRQTFDSGGYLLILFENRAMFGVVGVRTRKAIRVLEPFVEPRRPPPNGDSGSGAPSHVAAWKR